MRYRTILPVAAMTLGLSVAGCGGGGNIGDLVDTVTGLIPDTKKPLPGERKQVFPEGVPGVPQGVPPELVKGYQSAPETTATAEPGAQADKPPGDSKQAKTAEPEKPKPKPKKKTVAKPPAQPSQNQANQGASPGVSPAQSAAPWPAPQSQPTAAWPAPAPQSQPTAAWPDPRQPPQQRTQ